MIVSTPSPESLLRAVRNFPAAPMILARLGRMMADLDSPLDDIAAVLKCDAALATRILRIANSVTYRAGEPCASLEEAMLRVGFTEVYRLTGFAATTQIVEGKLSSYGVTATQFRENALLTALIMEEVAPAADVDQPTAYTVGLLRGIGKIALDRWALASREAAREPLGAGVLGVAETERFGMLSCEAAEVILKEWQFPAEAVEAIRHHYQPPAELRLANVLNLAAGAAEGAGFGAPGETSYWAAPAERLDATGLDEAHVVAALERATERFSAVRAAVM